MVIHNANLPFTYNDADAIPYELVKRDKLVLDQLVREGLVLDNRDRVMEEKVESLDPSTILDTNYKCTEYCPKTLGQVLPGVTAQDEDGKTWIKTCTLCCQTIIPTTLLHCMSIERRQTFAAWLSVADDSVDD